VARRPAISINERLFLRQVRHVHPDIRDPRTAAVRRQIVRDFGALVPPFLLHLPAPDVASACWAIAREPSCGPRVSRAEKEAVAAAVSTINACPYCVDVHTTTLHALTDSAPAAAIAAENPDHIADPALRDLVAWARATRTPDAPIVRQRPFDDEHAPELIGTAVAFHYINRMVNIFAAESPFPLANSRTKPLLKALAVPAFRRLMARDVQPGASLGLLSPAQLPADLSWANTDSVIADAYGRAAAVFETAGQQVLPMQVRQLVHERLADWRGEDPGLSRAWVDDAIATLATHHRPLGRLVLLAAFASYQVDAQVVDDARNRLEPAADEALIAATAWASFSAARRIGSWLGSQIS
jgi:AhpD family alkylhydroperoxidase